MRLPRAAHSKLPAIVSMRFSGLWNNSSCRRRRRPVRTRACRRSSRSLHQNRDLRARVRDPRIKIVSSGTSAGFGRRLAALVYDAILLAALLVVFTSGAVYLNHRTAVEPESAGGGGRPSPGGLARGRAGVL